MNRRLAMSFTLSALLLGGSMVGCTHDAHVASASDQDGAKIAAQAADLADKATKTLAKKDGAKAVRFAEAAVTLQPRNASYRGLLAQSYMQAGRFASAHQAFVDTLSLDANNSRAALGLALAETAQGRWEAARQTLADHAANIPASDRGLALALAGDPKGAVAILMPAARAPGAGATTRQNLALAFALAGDWRDARAIVGMDLSPADVDKRLGRWAQLAHPRSAADQVAALLGVKPAQDPGQPIALALNAPFVPLSPAAVDSDTTAVVAAVPQTQPSTVADNHIAVVFAARHEVVQPLPTGVTQSPGVEVAKGITKSVPRTIASGNYYVQLGAYENAAVARDGWARATHRLPMLGEQIPQGVKFNQNGTAYYRLSVGGFSRVGARDLCNAYRGRGGKCFIRLDAGDQVAKWAESGVQVAAL